MKIRIKGNSIRLRLTKPEVAQFGKDGYLEERTVFGNGTFTYALRNSDSDAQLAAGFEDNTITMYVPAAMATEWVNTNTVGYSATMDTGMGQMALLLEKDFKCIDGDVQEDQSDNYENPLLHCK